MNLQFKGVTLQSQTWSSGIYKPIILTPKLPIGCRLSSIGITHGSFIAFLFEKTDLLFL